MHVCTDHISDGAGLEWTVQGEFRSSIVHLGGWGCCSTRFMHDYLGQDLFQVSCAQAYGAYRHISRSSNVFLERPYRVI
jgi:hypothetical protein